MHACVWFMSIDVQLLLIHSGVKWKYSICRSNHAANNTNISMVAPKKVNNSSAAAAVVVLVVDYLFNFRFGILNMPLNAVVPSRINNNLKWRKFLDLISGFLVYFCFCFHFLQFFLNQQRPTKNSCASLAYFYSTAIRFISCTRCKYSDDVMKERTTQ